MEQVMSIHNGIKSTHFIEIVTHRQGALQSGQVSLNFLFFALDER